MKTMTALMICCGLFAAEASGAGAAGASGSHIQLVLDRGGHTAPITALAFTPDSKQLVSASDDKTIRVWDLASRQTLRVIRGEIGSADFGKIGAMALAPDGRLLAAAVRPVTPDKGPVIRLYDFASGTQIGLLEGHDGGIHSLAFSSDGRHLISGSSDHTSMIWDTDARKVVHVLKEHRGAVSGTGFTPDGLRAVTASQDHSLRLWRVADGALLREMTGHTAEVVSMAIAADGTIASQDKTGAIGFWDGRTGTFIKTITPFPWSGALAFSPDDSELLLTCGSSSWCPANSQYVISTATGRENAIYDHDGLVTAGAISPDGHWAATGDDRDIHLWEPRHGVRQQDANGVWQTIILGGAGNPVLAAAFAADGREIAWGAREHLRLASIESSAGVPPENDRGPLEFVWMLPQRDDAIASPQPLPGHRWFRDETSFARAASVHKVGGEQKPAIRLQIDSAKLSSAGLTLEDVRGVVDMIAKHEQLTVPELYDDVIIAYRNGAAIRVRDVGKVVEAATDRTIAGFQNNRHGVRVLVKPGGSQGRKDAILIIRNGSHTTFIERNAASGSGHLASGITPDGKTVISGGKDGVLAAYDLEGRKLGDFAGHSGDVLALAPSPDGRYLVSGASDQTVRLWNLRTHELLVTLYYAADGEWAIWTPQGYYAASPDGGKLFGWQINRGPERNADYVAAERLRTRFYRPDIVARAIIVGSAKEAAATGNGHSLEELLGTLPPRR